MLLEINMARKYGLVVHFVSGNVSHVSVLSVSVLRVLALRLGLLCNRQRHIGGCLCHGHMFVCTAIALCGDSSMVR